MSQVNEKSVGKYSDVHIIGLGGTGTNLIQRLIESPRLLQLLESEDSNLSLMAIDVADGDLEALNLAYENAKNRLVNARILVDRLYLRALKVRFNSPNTLFEFLNKLDGYLEGEGIKVANYRPWISSMIQIPPLAGGVGRMRALSKAIYNLNFYYYNELSSALSLFVDRVKRSVRQPIVLIVFGLGGGTGSGMVMDLARHLRVKLGSAVPIIALVVLPSSADDPVARGISPYTALQEFELLFNNELNSKVVETFGRTYVNPFTALFFLSLDPVYNLKSTLIEAKADLDDAIVDLVYSMRFFDLADLTSRTGTNNDFGRNWVHAAGFLKISYPLDQYIAYIKGQLQTLKLLGDFMLEKAEILERARRLLDSEFQELRWIYQTFLASQGQFNPQTFEGELDSVISRGGRYETLFKQELNGLRDFYSYYVEKFANVVKGLRFPDDTNEGAVVSDVNRYLDKVRNLSSTYEELSVVDVKDVQERISAGRNFTPSQMEALNSSLNFISSIRNVVTAFQLYTRTRILAEELSKRPLNEGSKQRLGKVNERLRILYPLMQVLTHKPENEGKLIDDVVLQVRTTLRNSAQERLTNKQREVDFLRGEVDRLANEAEEFRKQLKKGLGIFSNKKPIQRNLESTEEELHQRQGQLELASRELEFAKTYNDLVAQVVDRLDATKPYRKELAQVVARERELNKLLTSVTSTSRFYEKIVELSEEERVRIMEMILQERETELREPGTLRDILNMERFKNILSSHMKVFSTPSYVGFNNDYRTDVIWVTVSLPEGMWDMDLQMRLMNVLSGNINVEASKAVTIKQIPQVDPWTISLTVFFAKGRAENLEKYPSMQRDSQVVRPGDRYLYRSFLLEQGVQDVEALVSQLQGGEGEREAQRQG